MSPWIFLCIAVGFEIAGTTFLKLSEGFSKWGFGISTIVLYTISFYFLAQTLKTLPLGITYALWSGLGTLAVAIIGIIFFHEQLSWLKALFILFIIVGCVGLNLIIKSS